MSSEFELNLDKYAEVIVRIGLNIQPGQRLLIGSPLWGHYGTPIELFPLVRMVVAKAYQAGTKFVEVMWEDRQLALTRFQHAPRDSFEEFPTWRASAAIEAAESGDAVLVLAGINPDLLIEQDPTLTSTAYQIGAAHVKPFFDLRGKNKMNFALIAAPGEGWANTVFPDLRPEDRLALFWDTIFEICRVKQPDPVSAWKDHLDNLAAKCEYLNGKRYASLHLVAPGTDLKLKLPNDHIWGSARQTTQSGIDFTTNIPTEEVFTIPHKDETEGIVTSTKPLSLGAGLVEKFSLTFSEGKVVKATAEKGENHLHRLLETYEGADRLGEVALVPNSSPISKTDRLFYIPLIDENAANHLAFGQAYKISIKGGETMADDEFAAVGGNNSLIHQDFMVGSGEMDVDGLTEDGIAEPIMRDGEWAFDL